MTRLYDMSLELPDDYLLAYARMVIGFGRLEGSIKLAIKNLAVSLKISKNFMEGLQQAEEKRSVVLMCEHMLNLHIQKYGECDEAGELTKFVKHVTKLAADRNHFVAARQSR